MPISPYVAQCDEYPFRLLHVEAGRPQPGDDWIRRFAPIPPRIEVVQLSAGPSRKSRTLQPFLPHVAIPVQPCADCVEYGIRRDLHALAGGLDKTVRSDVESYRPPALFAQTLRLETFQQVATTIPFSDLTVFVHLMHVQPTMVGTTEQHSTPMPRLLPADGAGGRLVIAKNDTPIVFARPFRTVIGGRQCLICGACRLHIPAASDHETRRVRLIHDLSQAHARSDRTRGSGRDSPHSCGSCRRTGERRTRTLDSRRGAPWSTSTGIAFRSFSRQAFQSNPTAWRNAPAISVRSQVKSGS